MQTVDISLDQLLPPVVIMREDMDREKMQELVADIKAHGIEQPLIVTPHEDKYRVVAGWRRKLAAQMADLLEVPCIVKDLDEEGQVDMMLRENLHREETNPVEEGKMFAVMHEAFHLTVEGISLRTGKSTAYIQARLSIMHGPEDVREALRIGEVSLSVARELNRATNDDDRAYCLYYARFGGATTDTVRRWVAERNLIRLAGETGPAPGVAPTSVEPPAVVMGRCEWHKGEVPLDATLSFQVCGECYRALTNLRDEMAKQPDQKEGADHDVVSTRTPDRAASGDGSPGGQ